MIHFYFMKITFKFHPVFCYLVLKVIRSVIDKRIFSANEWTGNRMLQDWGWSEGTKIGLESCYIQSHSHPSRGVEGLKC